MKKRIYTLQDALAFQLQGIHYAETKVKEEVYRCMPQINSEKLKEEMRRYIASAGNKLVKLDRIFNYLMQEPDFRKNKAVVKLLDETKEMLSFTDSPHLRDILMVSCMQNINAYKISSLKIAYMFTVELELDTASELLQEMLESELETAKALSALALDEFNKCQEMVSV